MPHVTSKRKRDSTSANMVVIGLCFGCKKWYALDEEEKDDRHKENNENELRSQFLKSCKSIIFFMYIASLGIGHSLKVAQSEPKWCKVHRVLLLSMALYHIIPFLTSAHKTLTSTEAVQTFGFVFYCDNILVVALLINFWRNNTKMTTILNQLVTGVQMRNKWFSSLARCSNILFILGIFNMFLLFLPITIQCYLMEDDVKDYLINNMYLLHVPTQFRDVTVFLLQLNKYFMIICVYIFFCMVTLIIFMLSLCFKQLNMKLLMTNVTELNEFQTFENDHQRLATLVRQTSECFSPALLLIVTVKCIQIIFGANVIHVTIMKLDSNYWTFYVILTSLAYLNAIGIVLVLALMGGSLQSEVITNSLLDL